MRKKKTCSNCGGLGPFRKTKSGRLASWCNPCQATNTKRWRQNNKERHRATSRAWSKNNPEKARANRNRWAKKNRVAIRRKDNAWRKKNKDKLRKYYLKWKYDLTLEAFARMFTEQRGRCAICECPLKPGNGTNIEHCHKTHRVRGLTCRACNLGLENFKDSPELLRKAATYLEQPKQETT